MGRALPNPAISFMCYKCMFKSSDGTKFYRRLIKYVVASGNSRVNEVIVCLPCERAFSKEFLREGRQKDLFGV